MSKFKNKEMHEMQETQATDQHPDQFQLQKQQMFFQIKHLNQQRVQQEAEQEFENAARVKEELMRLGEEFKNLVVYELRRKQEEEREMFEMQYQQEIQNLNQNWGQVLMQNEQEIEEYLMSLDERQQNDFEQARNKLFENVKTGRYTPEILNLEYQMQQLVKKQRYKEAAHLKKKMIKLIEKQNIKNNRKAQSSITNKLENFQEQQLKEKAAVEQKLIAQRNELLLRREKDFQSIEYKYNVYKEKLDLKHQHQVMDQQKNLKNFNPSSNYFLQDFEDYDDEQSNFMFNIFLSFNR